MQKMKMNPEQTTTKYSRYLVKVLMKRYQSMPRFGARSVNFFVTSYVSFNVSKLHPKIMIAARFAQVNQNRKQTRKTRISRGKESIEYLNCICCQFKFYKKRYSQQI
jgi:hypothetical protein